MEARYAFSIHPSNTGPQNSYLGLTRTRIGFLFETPLAADAAAPLAAALAPPSTSMSSTMVARTEFLRRSDDPSAAAALISISFLRQLLLAVQIHAIGFLRAKITTISKFQENIWAF